LFVLLKDGDGSNNYSGQLWHALNGGADLDNDDVMAFVAKMGGGDYKAELPRAEWPMMVRFRDLNDPKSVERVDPAAAGVRRILLETTKDDVTVGIEKRLGWLPNQNGSFVRRLSVPDPTNPPIAAILNKRDFSTELK
jgi:hypothetical protein